MSEPFIITTDALVRELSQRLLASQGYMNCAESCTGGMLASTLTRCAGASRWFHSGLVTYSNQAKIEQLGVDQAQIESYGAVSEEVARAMAHGAQQRAPVILSISITGIAGPQGGSQEKPVGTVCFGLTLYNKNQSQTNHFIGSREHIREQSVLTALRFILSEFTPMV